jgi:hypothetical protein
MGQDSFAELFLAMRTFYSSANDLDLDIDEPGESDITWMMETQVYKNSQHKRHSRFEEKRDMMSYS